MRLFCDAKHGSHGLGVQIEATPFFGRWLKVAKAWTNGNTTYVFVGPPKEARTCAGGFWPTAFNKDARTKTMRLCPTKLWLQRFP